VFVAKVEGLEEKHDWYTDKCHQKQHNLHSCLTTVQLLVYCSRLQEHVDEHVKQRWRTATDSRPVDEPFVENTENQVTKDGLEEDHTGKVIAPEVYGLLEVDRVDQCPRQIVSHM